MLHEDIYYPVAHRSDEELDALKNRYALFDDSQIPSIFKKSLGMTPTTWTKPETWGTSHVVYIVSVKERPRPLVLRTNIGWGSPEVYMHIEKLLTDRVAELGVPVNRILHVDISRQTYTFDYQIQELVEGVDIEDHFRGNRDNYDRISFNLGICVATWGQLTYEGFGRFNEKAAVGDGLVGTKSSMYEYIITRLDEDIKYLVDASFIDLGKGESIRKIFEDYRPVMNVKEGTLVQHDLADHNIMFDGESVITGIFDWEAAVVGDPVLDLASASTWKTHYPREEKMIEGYKSVRDVPNFFQEKMNIYRLRTMLWKMVFAIRAGILNVQRKKSFDASLKPFYM